MSELSCQLSETQKLDLCREFSLASTMLLRTFFTAYGEDSLAIIKGFGKQLSDMLYEKNKALAGKSPKEIIMPFVCLIESLGGGPVELIDDTESQIVYRIHKCPSAFEFSDVDEKLCQTLNILEDNYAKRMDLEYEFVRRRSPENNTCEKRFSRKA